MVREALESNEGQMEAAVEALLEFGETRARVVGGEGVRGVSGSGAGAGPPGGGQEQIMRDELLAMQLQEELLREGGRAETPFVGGGKSHRRWGGSGDRSVRQLQTWATSPSPPAARWPRG